MIASPSARAFTNLLSLQSSAFELGVLIASRCSLCLCLLGLGKATFDCFLTVLVDARTPGQRT